MIPIRIEGGENKAWDILSGLDTEDVQKQASVKYDPSLKEYIISSFGIDFHVSPSKREIHVRSGGGEVLLDRLSDFFRLSLLWYLVGAKDIPATERLIKPIDVRGGQRFFTGSHTLPLDDISEMYGKDRNGFVKKGLSLGGTPTSYGDVSLKLFPLPRLPVYLILWLEDEEFPARADILFDSTCDMQIERSDIIWAVAMMSVLIML
jgi:hypothetical protein